jgi:hypothetical protein
VNKCILLIPIALVLYPAAYGATWHVEKDNAPGTENGKSWDTAFATLQAGIGGSSDAAEFTNRTNRVLLFVSKYARLI